MDFREGILHSVVDIIEEAKNNKVRAVNCGKVLVDGTEIKFTLCAEPPVFSKTKYAPDDTGIAIGTGRYGDDNQKFTTSVIEQLKQLEQ